MPEKKYLRSNLFELMSTFSKSEMRKFEEFLKSPYHNKSKKLIKAFQFIKKYYPEFKHDKLTLQNIHNFINPKKKYHAPTVRNVLSDVYKYALRYFAVQGFIGNEQSHIHYILYELNGRTLFNLFEKYSNRIKPLINGRKGWNIDLLLENARNISHMFNKELFIMETTGDNSKQTNLINNYHDKEFYFLNSFTISILIEIYINLILSHLDQGLDIHDRRIIKYLENNSFKYLRKQIEENENKNPLVTLSLKAYDTFSNNDDSSKYYDYRKTFFQVVDQLATVVKSTHCQILLSYCLRKREIPEHKKIFSNEMLSLYELMLEKELYKCADTKYLDSLIFRNMIVVSLDAGKFDWISKLINVHIDKLAKKDKEVMQNFGLMYIYFHSGNYDEAMDFANKINPSYRYLIFDITNTKLKIYFERQYYDSALDLIRSHKKTIENTNLISKEGKLKHLDILFIIKTLIMLKTGKKIIDNNLIKDLEMKIGNISLHGSIWCSKKLEEITGKIKKVGAA